MGIDQARCLLLLAAYVNPSQEIIRADGPYNVLVYGRFACQPDIGNCKRLAPGEEVSLIVNFFERSSYVEERSEAKRYDVDANFTGTLSMYLHFPKSEGDEVGTGMELIQTEVGLQIKLDKDIQP